MESGSNPPGSPDQPQGPQSPAGPQPPQSPQAPQPEQPAPAYPGAPAPQGAPPGGWYQPPPGYGPPVKQPPAGIQGRELASWGARLAAYTVDGLVLLVPGLILFFVLIAGAVGISGDEDVQVGAAIGAFVLWFLLMSVVAMLYAPLLMIREGRDGQTWGKQLLGIRAVRDNGQPFTFATAALREIVFKFLAVGLASSIIPFIPWFLDFFWPLWDDENRALHDMGAQTHVVRA